MKIRHESEIQRNKNKTFSIKLNRLINIVANILDKITKLPYFPLKSIVNRHFGIQFHGITHRIRES